MKNFYLLSLLLLSLFGFSQTNGITYQAVILNPSGQQLPGVNNEKAPLANTSICLKFAIIDHNAQIEYLETIQTTTDEFGMVNLIIGTGDKIGGYAASFTDILWNNNAKNLKVDLSITGVCSYYTEISNQPFTFVPFAMFALNTENTEAIFIIEDTLVSLQAELDATQVGSGLNTNGTYTANTTTNYISGSTSLVNATETLDGALALVQADVDANEAASNTADATLQTNINNLAATTSNTNTALQTELDATQVGSGLNTNGTYTANTTTNYISGSTSLVNATETLDGALVLVQADVDANEAASNTADATLQTNINNLAATTSNTNTALQTELDATQVGSGLNTNGTYTANTTTNYISGSTSLVNATETLDGALALVQADVDANEAASNTADATLQTNINNLAATTSNTNTALQTELDATQVGSGLNTNGTYTANTTTNYISGSTSLVNATEALDGALALVQADVNANEAASNTADATLQNNIDNLAATASNTNTTLQAELDATQVGSGLNTDGTYTANTTANYISGSTSLVNATEALDGALALVQADVDANEAASNTADATLQNNIDNLAATASNTNTTLQAELDATQVGSGLNTNGTYTANTTANYISGSTSLVNATEALDGALALVQADVDANEAASNTADATLQNNIDNLAATASNTNTTLQAELDATQVGSGLNTNGTYTANTTANYISGSTSLVNATEALDGALALVQADVDANEVNVNAALNLKANIASPTFTGTVSIPTLIAGTNTYPSTNGSANQVLTTNGAGMLMWTTPTTTATSYSGVLPISNGGTGSSTKNFVDLTTNQSISGVKTYWRNIKFFAQSYANTATMNIGFAPIGENLSGISFGIDALKSYQYGTNDVAVGNGALYKDLRGVDNIAIGYRALYNSGGSTNNDWGNQNVAIGANSGFNIMDSDKNTLLGTLTDISTDGINNATAIGYNAIVNLSNTIQLGNTEITNVKTSGTLTAGTVTYPKTHGTAGQVLSTTGSGALAWSTPSTTATSYSGILPISNGGTGSSTISFVDLVTNQTIAGTKTFSSNASFNGIRIGVGNAGGSSNLALGGGALGAVSSGHRNTALGNGSLQSYVGTGFDNNTSVGYNNLVGLTTGSGNTSVGAESMMGLQTGISNTSIGNQSFMNVTGSENVGVGKSVGNTITSGSRNTIIGAQADVAVNNLTNATALGYGAIAQTSNTIQLGNTSVTNVKTNGTITAGVVTYTNTSGTAGQVLMANGSGGTSWGTPATAVLEVTDEFSATVSQISFTLTNTPSVNSKVKMYINGIRISNSAYSWTGTTLTYNPVNNGGNNLTAGDRIQFDYFH